MLSCRCAAVNTTRSSTSSVGSARRDREAAATAEVVAVEQLLEHRDEDGDLERQPRSLPRSSTSSVGSGRDREAAALDIEAAATVEVVAGDQPLEPGDEDGDLQRQPRSASRSSRHSSRSDDAESRHSGDDRSRASYSVKFAEVSCYSNCYYSNSHSK